MLTATVELKPRDYKMLTDGQYIDAIRSETMKSTMYKVVL
jgi:hypothetical protein